MASEVGGLGFLVWGISALSWSLGVEGLGLRCFGLGDFEFRC